MPLKTGSLLAAVVVLALAADLSAQKIHFRGHPAPPADNEEVIENVFPAPPRSTLKLLSDSRKLLAEGRLGEAIRKLGDILESPEDFLVQPDKSSPVHGSLKAEAERLLGEMPREGRDLYELQYGARARQMLTEALDAGDMERLAEVSRRFFHTRAGYQATFLLGLDHFDRGRPMAGALVLQRLRQAGPAVDELEPALSLTLAACWLKAGTSEKAREALSALRARDPALRVTVAGRELPLFEDDAGAVDWLAGLIGPPPATPPAETDRWWMFRGNAARNASAAGGAPLLNVRWRVLATDDPLAESALDQCQRLFAENGSPVLPAFYPLAVGDVLLMRTLQNLVAVDFATGKLLWEVPVDDGAESPSGGPAAEVQLRQSILASNVGQRMWRDMTFGTLSSDGRCVYSIEDLDPDYGQGMPVVVQRMVILGRAGFVNPRALNGEQAAACNRLAAHDIRTGKLVWDLGGPAGPHALRQAETFFLGPPLPLMGQLYVLAETKGEVRLLALEAATGNLLWSQQLSQTEQSDPQYRWAGASPAYADGVLVCPTSIGAIVGVELATRSLRWGYCYSRERASLRNRGIAIGPGGPSAARWADGIAAIRDGRVLVTPLESDWLHCLSLIDGGLLWKCPRQDDLYVACVDRDKVVLVGRSSVRAVQLSDGKPAWGGRTVALPKQSAPSGRGFQSGNRYFLPLTSAEVVAIELGEGKLVGNWKSRKGNVPGNLVCHKGQIVSQGAGGVCAYFQLDTVAAEVRQRLAANPSDPEALSLEGEILLSADKCPEAIASFRRAYQLAPDPRTRELLRDSLLEGLRSDFAAYRGQSAEIERLLDDAPGRAAFLRAMAGGLRRAGDWAEAFESYQKLADLEPDRRPLDPVDGSLCVRRDRWVQSQLAELRKQAGPAAAAAIDKSLSTRLRSAVAARSLEPLQEFVNYFGNQPAAAAASGELVRRLRGAGRLLEAELAAVSAGAPPAGPAGEAHGLQDAEWPTGKLEVSTARTRSLAGLNHASFPVEWQGPHPLLADLALRFDFSRVAIIACDGYGRERWQVSLMENGQRQDFAYNPTRSHARAFGHLLLVSLGWKIVAIDGLGLGPKGAPRVLWTQDLTGSARDAVRLRRMAPPLGMLPVQLQQQFFQSPDPSSLSGSLGSRQICVQRLRELVAMDPCSGETLWVRQGFPQGCELFGDDRYVFVLSPEREEAALLSASDGELLGTRKIPRLSGTQSLPNGQTKTVYSPLEASSLGTFGRNVLLWWPEGNKRVMTLIDPLEGRDIWAGWKFAASAHASVADEEAVGVMEPSGRFVLVSLPDGRTIADLKLEAEPTLQEISVFRSAGRYYLLTRGGPGAGPTPPLQPMPHGVFRAYSPIHRGRLYAFDQQGKPLWPAPAVIENQLLVGNQPVELPLLVFGCQLYKQAPNGQGQWKPTLLCVDKRSGQTAYQGQFNNQIGIFGVRCDPEKKTVDLIVQNDTVTLKFTDKPTPPPSAGAQPAKPPADKPPAPSGT